MRMTSLQWIGAIGLLAGLAGCAPTLVAPIPVDAGSGDVVTDAGSDEGAVDSGRGDVAADVSTVDVAVDAGTCALPDGTTCPVGHTCPAGDRCNDCTCGLDGRLTCTARPCALRLCTSTSECGAAQECQGPPGCATPWHCGPRLGRACTADLAPFCGCDGGTFRGSSTCPPHPYAHAGVCEGVPPPDAGTPDADTPDAGPATCRLPDGSLCAVGRTCPAGDGCNECSCSAGGRAACTLRACPPDAGAPDSGTAPDGGAEPGCPLPDGTICPFDRTCPAGDRCNDCTCGLDGHLTCTARPCALRLCTSTSECGTAQECQGPPGCATPWHCGPRLGRACTADLAPFCGCDGGTFHGSSTCPPHPYAHAGACP